MRGRTSAATDTSSPPIPFTGFLEEFIRPMAAAGNPAIGFIGLGGWGTTNADTVSDLGGTVVAGADVSPTARERFAATFDVPTVEHWDELPYDRLDGVVIGTPNTYHAPAAIHALEQDVAAYVAKPMADSTAAADEMITAAAESNAFGMVGFVSRFRAGVDLFRAYHTDDTFGDITHVEIEVIRRRGIPGRGSWFCNDALAGGGSLYDIGVHAIDAAMYMLEFPTPVTILGATRQEFGPREQYADPDGWSDHWELTEEPFTVDDSASGFVRFDSGLTMSIETAWATNREPSNRTILRGTEAGAVLGGDGALEINTARSNGIDHYVDTTLRGERAHTGHAGAQAVFLEAIRAAQPPGTCTFEEGKLTQQIMDGIYQSDEQAAAIRL